MKKSLIPIMAAFTSVGCMIPVCEKPEEKLMQEEVDVTKLDAFCEPNTVVSFEDLGYDDLLEEQFSTIRKRLEDLDLSEYEKNVSVIPKFANLCTLRRDRDDIWNPRGYSAARSYYADLTALNRYPIFFLDKDWAFTDDFPTYIRHEIAHGMQGTTNIWYVEATAMYIAEQKPFTDRPMHDTTQLWVNSLLRENCTTSADISECEKHIMRELVGNSLNYGYDIHSYSLMNIPIPNTLIEEMEILIGTRKSPITYLKSARFLTEVTIEILQTSSEIAHWIRYLTETRNPAKNSQKVTVTSDMSSIIITPEKGEPITYNVFNQQTPGSFEYHIADVDMLRTIGILLTFPDTRIPDLQSNNQDYLDYSSLYNAFLNTKKRLNTVY